MDRIDLQILAILQDDAAVTVADISSRVALSPTPCWKRIQKMEALGILTRRVALLCAAKARAGADGSHHHPGRRACAR